MHPKKSNRAATLLLFIICYPILLVIYLHFTTWQLHRHMEEAMESQQLSTIVLPLAKVVWIKKGKEILYGGNYFDVKSYKTHGNIVILTGLPDAEEKKIAQQLQQLDRRNNNIYQNKAIGILLPFWLKKCDIPPPTASFLQGGQNQLFIVQDPNNGYSNIILPPPNCS